MKGTPRPAASYRAARRNTVFAPPKGGKKGTWPRDNPVFKQAQEALDVRRKPKGKGQKK